MINNEFNPKHIILSRKGFDSAAGGDASMIVDIGNGKKVIQPLPIPDPYDTLGGTTYADIKSFVEGYDNLCRLMKDAEIIPMIKGHNPPINICHKDPDLFAKTKKGAFGQMGTAEAHLRRNKVGEGDLFLFFGWYKSYKLEGEKLIRQRGDECDDKHVLYGYLYVDKEYDLANKDRFDAVPKDYCNHPHYRKQKIDKTISNNRLYVAKEFIPGTSIPGYGVFKYKKDLVLSKEDAPKSMWKIDDGGFMSMLGKDREMTYHKNIDKCWQKDYFQSVARGQEFIINSSGDENKEFRDYIYQFILDHAK